MSLCVRVEMFEVQCHAAALFSRYHSVTCVTLVLPQDLQDTGCVPRDIKYGVRLYGKVRAVQRYSVTALYELLWECHSASCRARRRGPARLFDTQAVSVQ